MTTKAGGAGRSVQPPPFQSPTTGPSSATIVRGRSNVASTGLSHLAPTPTLLRSPSILRTIPSCDLDDSGSSSSEEEETVVETGADPEYLQAEEVYNRSEGAASTIQTNFKSYYTKLNVAAATIQYKYRMKKGLQDDTTTLATKHVTFSEVALECTERSSSEEDGDDIEKNNEEGDDEVSKDDRSDLWSAILMAIVTSGVMLAVTFGKCFGKCGKQQDDEGGTNANNLVPDGVDAAIDPGAATTQSAGGGGGGGGGGGNAGPAPQPP